MFVFKSFIFQTPSEKEVDLVKYLETAEETCQSSQSSPTRLGKITYFLYLILVPKNIVMIIQRLILKF